MEFLRAASLGFNFTGYYVEKTVNHCNEAIAKKPLHQSHWKVTSFF